jgi:SagB-type dehydrogenase family enzyme
VLPQSLFLFLRDGVSVSLASTDELVVASSSARLTFRKMRRGTRTALERLACCGADESTLQEFILETDGPSSLASFYYYLDRLTERGLLVRAAEDGGERLASLTATSSHFVFSGREAAPNQPYTLSRFAYLRRHGDELVMESPLSYTRVSFQSPRGAALVQALVKPADITDLVQVVPGLTPTAAAMVLKLLLNGGMLQESARGRIPEAKNTALDLWEFHDLLFHSRSRPGLDNDAAVDTDGLASALDLAPALKPIQAGEWLELDRPDLDQLQKEDLPFARVQETRRSLREYAARAINCRQLGEFLYRVARVREYQHIELATPKGPVQLSLAPRPYPSGGALYELELYAAINACEDVLPGLYYYHPGDHRLGKLSERTSEVDKLLAQAGMSAQMSSDRLQVLLIVAARFPRIAWKYRALSYSLILKNVGVVYQTMYLVATAMGLAPCALGCGDPQLFARAAGTDCYAETSVGEFLLGSKA